MESQSNPVENEAFWREHYELLKTSGTSRSAYCRLHCLSYDRFGYWIHKWNRDNNNCNKLIAVKIKAQSQSIHQPLLCTLDLKQGHTLRIHDLQTLSTILEKYS